MLASPKLAALIVLSSIAFSSAIAQPNRAAAISGRVVDAETDLPLVGAHVFIASSMVGTITDNDGRYRLDRVPTGALRLYVSMLGFEPQFKDMLLRAAQMYTFDFALETKIVDVGEAIVEAEGDEHWLERLEKFTRLFIGETPNSEFVTISNPEVLDFQDSGGSLTAYATEPLEIENNALGYKIQYFLNDFKAEPTRTSYDGEPLYEEMTPSTPEEAQRWKANRKIAFMGSFRHFLLALLSQRTEGQGFKTYTRPGMKGAVGGGTFQSNSSVSNARFPLDADKILKPGETATDHILDFEGYIEITYMGEEEHPSFAEWQGDYGVRGARFQTSWITMERGPTAVDYKGDILNPYGVTFSGYLAFERVAEEVPKEYRPR